MLKQIINSIKQVPSVTWYFLSNHLGKISSHTLGWLTIILLHLSSVPTLLAVLLNKSDTLPPVDMILFIWAGLIAMFFKSLIERNSLYIATICLGFVAQTVIMSLILFK